MIGLNMPQQLLSQIRRQRYELYNPVPLAQRFNNYGQARELILFGMCFDTKAARHFVMRTSEIRKLDKINDVLKY